MIYAYSDTATRDGHAVVATLLLTEDKFLDICSSIYDNIPTIPEGELMGIIQALESAKDCDYPSDEITIMCDSATVVSSANKVLNAGRVEANANHRALWSHFLLLCKNRRVRITHVKSHQIGYNPNKVCDLLAKYTLKKVCKLCPTR